MSDAKEVCKTLKSKGVKVFLLTDCDQDEFEKVATEYRKWMTNHPNALAFFYFAGHAVEHRNHNWLLLVSKSEEQRKLTKDSICLTKFIAQYVEI